MLYKREFLWNKYNKEIESFKTRVKKKKTKQNVIKKKTIRLH